MLDIICNYIVLAGAVITAIITILRAFGKPVSFLKKRKDAEEAARNEKIVNEVSDKVIDAIAPQLEEIKGQNINQNDLIEALIAGSRDMLRHFILNIYDKGKNTRTITETERGLLDDFYSDYKKIKGNHYIDQIYKKMENWKIVPDEEGVDQQ